MSWAGRSGPTGRRCNDAAQRARRWGGWDSLLSLPALRQAVAARIHAAERALADPDPLYGTRPVREAAEIVQAAYREVAGG